MIKGEAGLIDETADHQKSKKTVLVKLQVPTSEDAITPKVFATPTASAPKKITIGQMLIDQIRKKRLPKEMLANLDFDRVYENEEEFLAIDQKRKVRLNQKMLKPKILKAEETFASADEYQMLTKKVAGKFQPELILQKFDVERRSIIGDNESYNVGHNLK